VHVRNVDSSTLVFSLSSYRLIHKFCLYLSLSPFIINNPVYVRRVISLVLVCSLSSHRHSYTSYLCLSLYRFIINNVLEFKQRSSSFRVGLGVSGTTMVSGSCGCSGHLWISRVLTSSLSLGISSLFCRATQCM